MRYHSEKPDFSVPIYGVSYYCDHPVYSYGTLYFDKGKGFVVVQQRWNETAKSTWWDSIDAWIANAIYLSPKFPEYFDKIAKEAKDGLYPTVTVRQAMWALRIKPLKKERWETVFDRPII